MNWRDREESRFADGTYKALPRLSLLEDLGVVIPTEHYLHISVTESETDTIAYTASPEHGERDRQTRTRFGRYLKKHFSGLSDAQIQSCVVQLRAKLGLQTTTAELRFATDRATIDRIFETPMGPCDSRSTSCMYGKFTDWPNRPYHVYADSPDVAVAYVVQSDAIVARSVVNQVAKTWIRLYARDGAECSCSLLEGLLTQAGYKAGSLVGARLTQLPQPSRLPILPYIDHGGMGVYSHHGYWVVCEDDDSDAEYKANDTEGHGNSLEPTCSGCDNPESDCECIYCECCEERSPDGCEICYMCEQCDSCREHGGCECNYCEHCDRIVSPRSRYVSACACARCSDCGEREQNCECEPETDDEEMEVTGASASE